MYVVPSDFRAFGADGAAAFGAFGGGTDAPSPDHRFQRKNRKYVRK